MLYNNVCVNNSKTSCVNVDVGAYIRAFRLMNDAIAAPTMAPKWIRKISFDLFLYKTNQINLPNAHKYICDILVVLSVIKINISNTIVTLIRWMNWWIGERIDRWIERMVG